jgi:uncharacterized delta-60 repeat protein
VKKIIFFLSFIISGFGYSQVAPEWISFFNGPTNFDDQIENVVFDNSGNIYLSGYGYETVGGQGQDFFMVKCNSSGTEEWSNIYNGPQNDTERPYGLFVDIAGNVYVTGTSRWTASSYKIVTIKYSPSGDLLWTSAYDSLGTAEGEAHAVTVDDVGNVFITGRVSPDNNSYYDMATIKMDANGNVLDYTYYGQSLGFTEDGTNIITDSDGNVYIAGNADNSSFGQEVIIIKYNNSLDTLWSVHINGNDNAYNEFAIDIALDDTSNVYALCRLQNDPGFTDFAVVKINSSGQVIWREEFDQDGGQDIPEDMVMDDEGNIYVTGRVRRTGGGGYNDFVVIKYNNAGVQQWKSYYDGPEHFDDDPIGINVDQNGNVYVCGESNPNGGSHFKFTVVKFNADGSFDWDYVYDENVSSKAVGIWIDNSGFVYAGGEGESPNGNHDLMVVKLNSTTGVEEEYENSLKSFRLEQNYPNPFNPTTNFEFRIASFGFVSLKVFDVLGKEVATLVNEEKPAGNYKIAFDASGLSSGVYFYKLQSGNFVESKKMILLR